VADGNGRAPTILVTDAGRGSAVAIIRSLGRKGYRVIAADADPRSVGFRSRYVARTFVYPAPSPSAEQFCTRLLAFAKTEGVDLVIPVTDFAIQPLAAARHRFDGVTRLALPSAEALAVVTDKSKTLDLARRLGIPLPETRVVHSAREAVIQAEALGWPVVLKPLASKRLLVSGTIESFSVTYAGSSAELAAAMRRLEGRCPVLLQKYLKGTGVGIELLLSEGRPLAAFAHKRLREIPLTGGVSSFRESVALDDELYDYALRLLRELRWTGLAMVEFKVSATRTELMEINGRVWGSLPLAVASGVDFPALLATLCLGGEAAIEPHLGTQYRVGVRCRDLQRDLIWIGSVLARRQPYPYLPTPRRREALLACLGLFNPLAKQDLFTLDDPLPGLWELPTILHRFWRKARTVGAVDTTWDA
jgi:predicted ATP-grasp superfamily ATP-dependent carboligase